MPTSLSLKLRSRLAFMPTQEMSKTQCLVTQINLLLLGSLDGDFDGLPPAAS